MTAVPPSPPPGLAQHLAQLSPEPEVPPGKTAQGGHPARPHSGSPLGTPHSGLDPQGVQGKLWGLTAAHGTELGGGSQVCTSWHGVWASPACNGRGGVPACGFAHLQSQEGGTG